MPRFAVSFDFQPDPVYKYTVKCAGEEASLDYTEAVSNPDNNVIHFATIEEMESVAKIMLSTAKAWKEGFLSN